MNMSSKQVEFIYRIVDKDYNVYVDRKFQRNIYFRFKNGSFYISCPKLTPRSQIVKGLNKYAERLIKQYNKRHDNFSFEDDFVFLLGESYSLKALNIENTKELQAFLVENAKKVFKNLVRKNEEKMGIKEPYKIKLKNTQAQFGSNSLKTHTLSFQLSLIHYSEEIIESVVIHELAHEYYRNHQKEFYNVVYKYCPNYDLVQRKLKKGIHK